jgi:hypothetical protein
VNKLLMIGFRRIAGWTLLFAFVTSASATSPPPIADYDVQLCMTAQRMLVNASEDAFDIKVLFGESNGFHVIQMDAEPGKVTIATTMGFVDIDRMQMISYVGCKMVNRERVNDVLGLQLADSGASCRNVNEYTYSVALDGLTVSERQRYDEQGRKLVFANDYVSATGAEWLPSQVDDYISSDAEGLTITAPSVQVPWDKTTHEFYQGTHHCKLITLTAMQRWMRSVAFTEGEELFPRTIPPCAAASSMTSVVGSCKFWFAPAQAYFCQDYSGAGWDAAEARAECSKRHASPEALAAADSKYEGLGGSYDSLSCDAREDSAAPVATCVFHCNAHDETLWHTLDAAASGPTATDMMRRACDLYIDRR